LETASPAQSENTVMSAMEALRGPLSASFRSAVQLRHHLDTAISAPFNRRTRAVRLDRGEERMAVEKYVVLVEADSDVTQSQRDDAVTRLVAAGEEAAAGLAGLTVSGLNEPLTGPAESLAVVQAWIDDSAGADPRAVIANLTGSVGARLSIWRVEEIVFLEPVQRKPSGEHARLNLFGTAAKRDDFTLEGFFDYWKNTHAPISASIPGSSGYVVSRVHDTVGMAVERTVDAFIELWYPSREAQASAGEHPLAAQAWEDVPRYARTDGHFWFAYEHVVVAPPDTGRGMFDPDGA
jgi:uncharacterized protein (TIGR02118 family)